jgi:hypothetical protein
MSERQAVLRSLALRLVAHAQKVLPRNRVDWARAMHHEVEHISGDPVAFAWAMGCVAASYMERAKTMISSDARVSRWVLSFEMLCCFVPLTFLFVATVMSLGHLDVTTAIVALTVAMTGPVGLIFAFKIVVLNRRLLTRLVTVALGVFAAWTVAVVSLHDVSEQVLAGSRSNADWWESFVLIALLPAMGIAHLIFLARRPAGSVVTT